MQENAKKVYDLLNKEFPNNDVTILDSNVVTLKLNSHIGYLDFDFFNKMQDLCGYEAKRSDMGILFLFTCISTQNPTPQPRTEEEEFIHAVTPLMEYLDKHHHPHMKVLVDSSRAELLEGQRMFKNPPYSK